MNINVKKIKKNTPSYIRFYCNCRMSMFEGATAFDQTLCWNNMSNINTIDWDTGSKAKWC